jgi:hypothetical protein
MSFSVVFLLKTIRITLNSDAIEGGVQKVSDECENFHISISHDGSSIPFHNLQLGDTCDPVNSECIHKQAIQDWWNLPELFDDESLVVD